MFKILLARLWFEKILFFLKIVVRISRKQIHKPMSVQYIFSIAGVCGKCVAWDRMVCAASLSVYPTPSGCWSVAVQPKMDSKEHKKGLPVGLAIFCEVGPSIS